MSDRKARELEIKRRKERLEQLRQAREAKKKEVTDKDVLSKVAEPSGSTAGSSSLARERENVDELLTSILGPSKDTSPAPAPLIPESITDVCPAADHSDTSGGGGANVVSPIRHNRRKVKLTMDQLMPINIKPRMVEVYAKQTQTECSADPSSEPEEDDENSFSTSAPVAADKPASHPLADRKPSESEDQHSLRITLSEEQKEHIISSEEFSAFIERSSRVMERALADTSDILFDLTSERKLESEGDGLRSLNVIKKRQFSDQRWTRGRSVSAIDWSPHHPGLLLSSYYTQETHGTDPDGVVLVWDLKFNKDTPDYIFNCYSPVMSVSFSQFHPNYVVGGTYSGQVVLWDTRSGKRTPVQRSLLSNTAHTYPIYCMELVGSQNAHNLISVATDGRLCSWNLDNLSQPQESLELQNQAPRPVAASSLSFPQNEVNKFVVGSEECTVYQCQRHGKKPGVTVQYEGHYGPVTSTSCHRAPSQQTDFSHLFISSSFDWTIKLWSLKLTTEQQISSKTSSPLCSFETNSDYVYDVQWSPIHPALFASVDGEGKLDFWSLNHDHEVPILTEQLDHALSKLSWAPSGQLLAVGDADGAVHVFEAGEGLCVPQSDEWTQLQHTLLEIQQSCISST